MIKVIVGTNTSRNEKVVDENSTTLRSVLEDAGINYAAGQTNIDGCTLQAGDIDKTFAEMGVTTKCFLLNVAKQDNA